MEIFKETRFWLNFAGLLPSFNPNLWYKAVVVLNLISLISASSFQVFYLLQSQDISEVTDAFSFFSQMYMIFLRCILFIYHNTTIQKFILDLEATIKDKISLGREKHHVRVENLASKLTKYFRILNSILATNYAIYPLVNIIYQIIMGIEITWILPIPANFPWNISSHPAYELTYIAIFFNIFSALISVLGLDTFFFCAIIYLSGCFDDVRDMIIESDSIVPPDDDGVSLIQDGDRERKRHLKKSVEYHNLTLSFVEKMEEFISSSLFVTYLIIIFLICAVLYQASTNVMSSKILRNLTFITACFLQLFVYTAFGTLITQKSEDIAFAVYSTQWYRVSPKMRKWYQMMLIKSQKPIYLTALKFFFSSLESFSKVVSSSMSAFALLQSLQE